MLLLSLAGVLLLEAEGAGVETAGEGSNVLTGGLLVLLTGGVLFLTGGLLVLLTGGVLFLTGGLLLLLTGGCVLRTGGSKRRTGGVFDLSVLLLLAGGV